MPADPARINAVFLTAADITDTLARDAYLGAACAGDEDLRGQVQVLLRAHDALHSPRQAATVHHAPTDVAGAVLAGRYKLVEEIGEGGMGTVWMARQTEPVKRLVAVKLIKPGMDSRAVLARFEAERQALAMMEHPNIAKVLDAGVAPDGRPFFVMELVKGTPITKYCDDRKLTPRQRLELFIPVCQAIQHAHQKGVIHRDLKPNNVLVALYDDHPVPKVIDFGVAKATSQPLTDLTLHTGFGAVVGTPEYMSPEQASFNNLDIDTRSDVYALGVLLYELLTGSPPFTRKELEKSGQLEIFRAIREQEPPRPSTRLSTAQTLPTLAANRSTEPTKLTRLLRSELDWVVMKALEKDRNRRYETAAGFAADVQRYLAGEPVQAVPPSAGYKLRKFVRKNRGPVLAAAVVFVALVAGIAGTTAGLIYADKARRAAQTAEANERAERAKADAALKDADEQRRKVEWQSVSHAIDLLDQFADERAFLQMAKLLRDIPAQDADLRQFVTMRLVTAMQHRSPLAPELEGTGGPKNLTASGLQFTPDGRHLVGVLEEDAVCVWEALTHRRVARLQESDAELRHWQLDPDGRRMGMATADDVVRVWEVPSGRVLLRTPPLAGPAVGAAPRESVLNRWLGARHLLVSVGHDKPARARLELWHIAEGRRVAVLGTHEGEVKAVAFGPDDAVVAVGYEGGKARVWRTGDGKPVKELALAEQVYAVAFSPSGRRAVTIDKELVRWWRTDTWEPDGPAAPAPTMMTVQLFPTDDAVIVSGTNPGLAGADLDQLVGWGHSTPVEIPGPSGRWAGKGTRLSGGRWLLDVTTRQFGQPSLTQRYHPDAAALADDGRWLVLRDEIIDLKTQKPLLPVWKVDAADLNRVVARPVRMPNRGYAWVLPEKPELVYVPPPTLDVPPDVLELWVQVILRCELTAEGELKYLTEPAWEDRRRMLSARALPTGDFPFPGRVVADRNYWLRGEAERLTVENPSPSEDARVLPLLDRLIAAEPSPLWHEQRAEVLQRAGRWLVAADDRLAGRRLSGSDADGSELDGTAWQWVKDSGQPAERYQGGVRLAEAARKASPHRWSAAETLGAGYYRVGRYREAVAELQVANDLFTREAILRRSLGPHLMSPLAGALAEANPAGRPVLVAFLAMAHHRNGEVELARARVAELRALMADPRVEKDPDTQSRFWEAVGVVEGKPPEK